jgi:hypothetical protein
LKRISFEVTKKPAKMGDNAALKKARSIKRKSMHGLSGKSIFQTGGRGNSTDEIVIQRSEDSDRQELLALSEQSQMADPPLSPKHSDEKKKHKKREGEEMEEAKAKKKTSEKEKKKKKKKVASGAFVLERTDLGSGSDKGAEELDEKPSVPPAKWGIMLWDFEKSQEGEISVSKDSFVNIVDESSPDWFGVFSQGSFVLFFVCPGSPTSACLPVRLIFSAQPQIILLFWVWQAI